MKVVVLIDRDVLNPENAQLDKSPGDAPGRMEYHVARALRALEYEVEVTAFDPDVVSTAQALKEGRPDLVFNLTEHVEGDRRKDAHVAALLELLHVPFTGTGAEGLALCRDKATGKRILGYHRIKVPRFASLPVGATKTAAKLKYPVIVKPIYEDGSDGISLASQVRGDEELEDRARMIHERMKQPVICEEYVEGRELYVGIIGNGRLRALPPRELRFGRTEEGGPTIATARVKWDAAYRKKWGIVYAFAELPPEVEKKVARVSKRIYSLLRMRDYGRIDLRLTPENDIVFLEANPNPDLSADEDLGEAAARVGIKHVQLVDRIVNLALRRYSK